MHDNRETELIFEFPDGKTLKKNLSLNLKASISVHSGISIAVSYNCLIGYNLSKVTAHAGECIKLAKVYYSILLYM